MKVSALMNSWEKSAAGQLTQEEYRVRLPIEDAAKIAALAEMFPRRIREQLMTDLLSAALDDLVTSLPYIQGDKIIAWDEEGDPIFEDAGQTPLYLRLTRKHLSRLET
jgi:hypothetical protein